MSQFYLQTYEYGPKVVTDSVNRAGRPIKERQLIKKDKILISKEEFSHFENVFFLLEIMDQDGSTDTLDLPSHLVCPQNISHVIQFLHQNQREASRWFKWTDWLEQGQQNPLRANKLMNSYYSNYSFPEKNFFDQLFSEQNYIENLSQLILLTDYLGFSHLHELCQLDLSQRLFSLSLEEKRSLLKLPDDLTQKQKDFLIRRNQGLLHLGEEFPDPEKIIICSLYSLDLDDVSDHILSYPSLNPLEKKFLTEYLVERFTEKEIEDIFNLKVEVSTLSSESDLMKKEKIVKEQLDFYYPEKSK